MIQGAQIDNSPIINLSTCIISPTLMEEIKPVFLVENEFE